MVSRLNTSVAMPTKDSSEKEAAMWKKRYEDLEKEMLDIFTLEQQAKKKE